VACGLSAPAKRLFAGSNAGCGPRQHLLLRIAVAGQARPTPPREIVEAGGGPAPPQSNCVGSPACLRMLPAPGAGLSRFRMVVSRTGEDCARLRPRRRALPPLQSCTLQSCNSTHRAGRQVNVLVPALSEIIRTRNINTQRLACEHTCSKKT